MKSSLFQENHQAPKKSESRIVIPDLKEQQGQGETEKRVDRAVKRKIGKIKCLYRHNPFYSCKKNESTFFLSLVHEKKASAKKESQKLAVDEVRAKSFKADKQATDQLNTLLNTLQVDTSKVKKRTPIISRLPSEYKFKAMLF